MRQFIHIFAVGLVAMGFALSSASAYAADQFQICKTAERGKLPKPYTESDRNPILIACHERYGARLRAKSLHTRAVDTARAALKQAVARNDKAAAHAARQAIKEADARLKSALKGADARLTATLRRLKS